MLNNKFYLEVAISDAQAKEGKIGREGGTTSYHFFIDPYCPLDFFSIVRASLCTPLELRPLMLISRRKLTNLIYLLGQEPCSTYKVGTIRTYITSESK